MPRPRRPYSRGRHSAPRRSPIARCEALEPRLVLDSTVVFNEVMYHPQDNSPALEFIELYNQQAVDMDLSGWSLARGVNYRFPEGTIVRGGGFLVVSVALVILEIKKIELADYLPSLFFAPLITWLCR